MADCTSLLQVSAASAQIEATAGEKVKTADGNPDYGHVSAILIGVVSAWIIVLTILGRESHSAAFEKGKVRLPIPSTLKREVSNPRLHRLPSSRTLDSMRWRRSRRKDSGWKTPRGVTFPRSSSTRAPGTRRWSELR